MANQNVYSRYVPEGVNRGNEYFAEAILTSACAPGDTVTVTVPDSVEILTPISAVIVAPPVSGVSALADYVLIQSVDFTNRKVVLLNDGGSTPAAGSKAIVRFIGG